MVGCVCYILEGRAIRLRYIISNLYISHSPSTSCAAVIRRKYKKYFKKRMRRGGFHDSSPLTGLYGSADANRIARLRHRTYIIRIAYYAAMEN